MRIAITSLRKRGKAQKDHGKDASDKLPPTIKNRFLKRLLEVILIFINRETIIFDPTREVPEAIKVLDQKKKDAMKKYEVRYKVENQMKVIFCYEYYMNLFKGKRYCAAR
jgi:hypothetical protein